MLGLRADHETGDILDKEQRCVMTVTSLDEVSHLLSRLGIDDSTKSRRATCRIAKHAARIRNHANLNPANARMTGDNLFRIVRLKLVKMTLIKQAFQNVAHVIGLAMIFRNYFVDLFGGSSSVRSAPILAGGSQASSRHRQLRHKLPDLRNRLFVILHSIMRNARNFTMRARAAERFIVNCLAGCSFDQVSSAQSHERGAFDHDDDVRKRRQISTAGDAWTHYG